MMLHWSICVRLLWVYHDLPMTSLWDLILHWDQRFGYVYHQFIMKTLSWGTMIISQGVHAYMCDWKCKSPTWAQEYSYSLSKHVFNLKKVVPYLKFVDVWLFYKYIWRANKPKESCSWHTLYITRRFLWTNKSRQTPRLLLHTSGFSRTL